MICPTCNSELLNDAAFCNHCGASVRRLRPGVRYAGFWRRVIATLIDLLLLAPAIEFGKEFLYAGLWRWDEHVGVELTGPLPGPESQESTFVMMKQMAGFGTMIFFLAAPYYALTESSALQGTLGKRLLGLRVTDLNGRRIRVGRAIVRHLARLISATPWHFGFAIAGFTARKQALHDMLVGTLVIIADGDKDKDEHGSPPIYKAICPNCSAELLTDAVFCSRCGEFVSHTRMPVYYAGFGRRAAAMLLDLLVLMPVVTVLLNCFPPATPQQLQAALQSAGKQIGNAERENLQFMSMMVSVYFCCLMFFVSGVYCTIMESSALQGTLGKRLLGLRVTDLDGRRIRVGRALGRWLAHLLSASLWLVGFLMSFFTPRKQTLHDIIAGTLVVIPERPGKTTESVRAS